MFGFAIICQIENNLLIMKILSPVYWTYHVVCLKVPYLDHFCTYYVNDIGNASDCEILSLADDTTLILSDPDLKCLYEK